MKKIMLITCYLIVAGALFASRTVSKEFVTITKLKNKTNVKMTTSWIDDEGYKQKVIEEKHWNVYDMEHYTSTRRYKGYYLESKALLFWILINEKLETELLIWSGEKDFIEFPIVTVVTTEDDENYYVDFNDDYYIVNIVIEKEK